MQGNPDSPRPLWAIPLTAGLFPAVAALVALYLSARLETEGEAYRWMRRYGIVFYFGFTFICMVISAGHLFRLAGPGSISLPMRFDRVLVGLCMVLLGLGLASAFSPLYSPDEQTRDRVGNALEWNGALIFTLFFLSLAWLWHATSFSAKLTTERRWRG
jgi:hypothetical protein